MTHDVTDDETFLIENLQAGFNSFGNNTTSCSWNKVLEGEKMFTGIVKQFIDSKSGREHLLEQLLELLSCKTKYNNSLTKPCSALFRIKLSGASPQVLA